LAREARELADELRPKLDKPQGRIDLLKRKAASVKSAGENWLINRRLNREGREDLRPFMLLWTTTRVCNFTCTYCCDHQGNKYPDLPNDGVLNTEDGIDLMRIMRTRASAVYFAGGEPTVRKDLPALTRAARDLQYYPIIVNTNGSLLHRNLAKEEWRTWLADMDQVIVSLDSLNLATLKDLWVYRKPHDVIRNLLMLRELSEEMNFKLMVNTVVTCDTIEDASDIVDLVNDLGIWLSLVPVNDGPVVDAKLVDIPAYRALANKVLERHRAGYRVVGSQRLIRRLLFAEKLTCRNTLKPHVDFDGRLVWPCKACVNVKPEYVNVLDFDHVDDLYDHASSLVNPTAFHGPAANQCGANCNWTQNYSTDAYAHGLAKPWSLASEIVNFAFRR
jgi:molybdenum cofactor biosynthesis enzyme MoaA